MGVATAGRLQVAVLPPRVQWLLSGVLPLAMG